MAFTFKLQKLQVQAYGNHLRAGLPQKSVEVMFNPASFSVKYANNFGKEQGINTSGQRLTYASTKSAEISLDLVLDGTGVTDLGGMALIGKGQPSVARQVDDFMQTCFVPDGKLHEPRFLKLQWGDAELKDFSCRLQSVDITYTLFDRAGSPLHATLKTTFVGDGENPKWLYQKSSPDLTHTRIVRGGDTLPLLAIEVYGSAAYYLRLAQANGLDDFRNLTPGQELLFPPLEP
jgi:nucleoid-associated protein YgaU